MTLVELSKIVVSENRQRREFDAAALAELGASIASKGLMHPIVVRNDGITLVAGERRLRVLHSLTKGYNHNGTPIPSGFAPVVRLSELDPLSIEEAELEENTVRMDLTWQERASAIDRLHNFRTRQAEVEGRVQTKSATVTEILGRTPGSGDATRIVGDSILIAKHLDDPDVAKAKSQKEALNIVKKKIAGEFNAVLAERYKNAKVESPHTLIHADCRTAFADLADGQFDVICTDPPYGIDAHKMDGLSGSNSGTKHKYEDSLEYAKDVWMTILTQSARVCKPAAHLYMFLDFRYWANLTLMAQGAGWTVWPRPIIWHKPSGGMLGDITRGPRMSYECILFAHRGDKRVTGTYLDVVISNPADTSLHAAAKPVEVITNLLRRSCIPGDHVLDPCCGSGTIFDAAKHLSLYATGMEADEQHYNTALRRLHG